MSQINLREQILNTAQAARKGGQKVSIRWALPTIDVYRGPDDGFFFQEHEAQALIDEALAATDEYDDVTAEDYILWLAQGW